MKFVIQAPLKLTQLEFWFTCDGYGSAGFVLLIISVVIISKNEKRSTRFPFPDLRIFAAFGGKSRENSHLFIAL